MNEPWKNEPDEVNFVDDKTGYQCAMRRNSGGVWCGYVRVPKGHPWFGKDYDWKVFVSKDWLENSKATVDELGVINVFCAELDTPENGAAEKYPISLLVRCHGGITYAEDGEYINKEKGEWWLGFDCGHAGDLHPKYLHTSGLSMLGTGVYRDQEYVRETLCKMAGDIKEWEQDERSRAKEKLGQLAKLRDREAAHQEADDVLCELLELLGYSDVVKAWEEVEKWYA